MVAGKIRRSTPVVIGEKRREGSVDLSKKIGGELERGPTVHGTPVG